MFTFEQSPDGITQVLHQVPSVGDLESSGCSLRGSVGISAGSVTADNFDAGVLTQPGGERSSFAIRQQVNGAATFEINEDGAVAMPTSKGPVVDAEHARGWMFFEGGVPDAPQQGIGTCGHGELTRHTCPGLAAGGETDQFQRRGEAC